jgi:hypothetical protein
MKERPRQAEGLPFGGDASTDVPSQETTREYPIQDLTPYLTAEYWEPNYLRFDRGIQLQKLDDIAILLKASGDYDSNEITELHERCQQDTNAAFDLYEGIVEPEQEGSFAFTVPTRQSALFPGSGKEAEQFLPLLRYTDPTTRYRTLVGNCPWVLGEYNEDENGKRGVMLFAPAYFDMMFDLPDRYPQENRAKNVGQEILQRTAEFARHRLGVEVMGLGAILPKVADFGQSISVEGLHTTTGHGGTVWLVKETIDKIKQEAAAGDTDTVGIVGAGSIGQSVADYVLSSDPSSSVLLFDVWGQRLQDVAKHLGERYDHRRVAVASNIAQVFHQAPISVSAVTRPIDIKAPEFEGIDLHGRFGVEDSQPHTLNGDFEEKGGKIAWVIGRDNTPLRVATRRTHVDHGGLGPAEQGEIWGCEMEAAAISLTREFSARIKDEVTPKDVQRIGTLCTRLGFTPAPLQNNGQHWQGKKT